MLPILEVTFSDVVYVSVCTFLTVILIGVLRHTINLAHASKPPSKDVTTQCEPENESGTSSNACADPVANGRPGSKVFSIKCNGDCQRVESASVDAAEMDKLKRHLVSLERELEASKATINNLKQSEQQLRNRLSDQIRRQFESGGAATNGDGVGKELGYRFEDINQEETSRPTLLIRRYNDLYSDARVDTLDALDDVRLNIGGSDEEGDQLKNNILLTCIVLAFHHADKEIRLIRDNVFNTVMGQQVATTKHSQSIPTDGTNKPSLRPTIDNTVSTLILKTSKHRQTAADVEAILDSLMTSPLCRRCPTLRQNQQLSTFINTCFRLAWSLSALNPPYCIRYDTIEKSMTTFDPDQHVRYHTSDADSLTIKSVVWPQLAERDSGKCVAKAVVIT